MKKHVKYKKVYLAPYSNNDLKLELKESIDWLSKKLESPLRGRIPFYIKEIEKYEKYRGYINYDMYKILMSYYEIFSINIIAENFKNNTSCEFIETLKKATKGIEFRNGDKVLKDESRNFIFELLMASYFAEKKFLIDLSTKTDFIVKDLNILVECKRVTSEKKILERINEAVKQIKKRKVKDENLGIVFIDISEVIDIPKRIVDQVPLENSLTLLTNLIDTESIVENISYDLDIELDGKISKYKEDIINIIADKNIVVVIVCNFLAYHMGLVEEDLIIGHQLYSIGNNNKIDNAIKKVFT